MNDPFNMQHRFGIMKSVTLGPEMDEATYEQVRNFNNGWVKDFDPAYESQMEQAHRFGPPGNITYVQVMPRLMGNLLKDVNKPFGDPVYFAAHIFPVCRDPHVRTHLLHTLDRLVTSKNPAYTISAVFGL